MKRKILLKMAGIFLLVFTIAFILPLQVVSANQFHRHNGEGRNQPNWWDQDNHQRDDTNRFEPRWDRNDWERPNLVVSNPNGDCIQNFIAYPGQFIESRFDRLHWGSGRVIDRSNVSDEAVAQIALRYDITEYCAIYKRTVNEQRFVGGGCWINVSRSEYRFQYQIMVYDKYNNTYPFNKYDYGKWLSESEYNLITDSQSGYGGYQNRPPDPNYMWEFKDFILRGIYY